VKARKGIDPVAYKLRTLVVVALGELLVLARVIVFVVSNSVEAKELLFIEKHRNITNSIHANV
jgi:hypothetical protein